MNAKYLNALEDIANQLGLSFHKEMETIYGDYNRYRIVLIPSKESQTFTLKLSLNQRGKLPDSKLAKQVVDGSKMIKNCQVQGHHVLYHLKAGRITKVTTGDNLREALMIITDFLKAEGFSSCCQECGTEGTESFYNVSGVPTICCEDCFRLHSESIVASEQAEGEKQENFLAGLVGGLLGSLLGVGVIILFGQLGFVSALSGIIMAVCSLKGYELLGGKLTGKGIIGTSIVMVIMVYVGTRLDWSISIASVVPEADFLTAFRVFPELLREGFIDAGAYYWDLTLVYIFTALGAIPTIIGIRKSKQAQGESYRMSA